MVGTEFSIPVENMKPRMADLLRKAATHETGRAGARKL
jgi:hypothetical protein